MLKSKPTGVNQKVTANWEATNRMTIQIFLSFWQKVGPDLTIEAGEASYNEWTDKNGSKC